MGAIILLTFEEVIRWWREEGIRVEECEDKPMGNPDSGGEPVVSNRRRCDYLRVDRRTGRSL